MFSDLNILYSDDVIPLNSYGNSIIITEVPNVSKYSLKACLRHILTSNPNVFFQTIQYSKRDEMVYFYTNKPISTNAWKNFCQKPLEHLENNQEILEEINQILTTEVNKEEDVISLARIAELMDARDDEYERIKEKFESHFKAVIDNEYNGTKNILVFGFDFLKNELRIGFKYWKDYEAIAFAKKDGDLYIANDESTYGQEILTILGDDISLLYDQFIQFSEFILDSKICIPSVNSKFLVDIKSSNVSFYTLYLHSSVKKSFELAKMNYDDDYDYTCNSNMVISELRGKEDALFERIFVRIDDCPSWSRQMLYDIRQEELMEMQEIEEEKRKEELRRQKILKIKNKFFNFFKND